MRTEKVSRETVEGITLWEMLEKIYKTKTAIKKALKKSVISNIAVEGMKWRD